MRAGESLEDAATTVARTPGIGRRICPRLSSGRAPGLEMLLRTLSLCSGSDSGCDRCAACLQAPIVAKADCGASACRRTLLGPAYVQDGVGEIDLIPTQVYKLGRPQTVAEGDKDLMVASL